MVEIPKNPVTDADIFEWNRLKNELARIKAQEMLLRKKIFEGLFTKEEGTEYRDLGNGYRLKAVASLDRSIDLPHFMSMKEVFAAAKINTDALIKYTPELVIKNYRTLTDEQRALVDSTLVIKPGSPQMSIVAPPEPKE